MKRLASDTNHIPNESHPAGVRGLKLLVVIHDVNNRNVAPRRGVTKPKLG